MLRLRLFGGLSLRFDDGSTAVSGRRPLALLALLAVGDRPRSRDQLIDFLWPDREIERGRNALNQTMFGIRRATNRPDIIVGRNDLSLSADAVSVDLAAFLSALARGDDAAAAVAYTGAFLDGFYVSGARELDRWIDEQRMALSRRAARVVLSLAQGAEGHGDLAAAAAFWGRLTEIDPFDERAMLGRIRSIAALDGRAAALQVAQAFSARMREDLDVELSHTLEAAIQQLRVTPHPAVTATAARLGAIPTTNGADEALSSAEPLSEATPPRHLADSRPRRMRGAAVAAAALVAGSAIAVAVAVAVAQRRGSPPSAFAGDTPPPPATTLVAVFPFSTDSLGHRIARLVTRDVDSAGAIRTILMPDRVDTGAARERARALGAQAFIVGDAIDADSLRLSASMYRVTDGVATARATSTGLSAAVVASVDRLSARLIAAQGASAAGLLTTVAADEARSIEAFKAYVRGDNALRAGRYGEALASFDNATREDTSFAIAYYKLAVAADWASRMPLVIPAARRAVALSGTLDQRVRLLLSAHLAWRELRLDDAEQSYRALLHEAPDNAEAWSQFGELLFHGNSSRGRSFTESREPFERVLALDPRNVTAITHLARIAARSHDITRVSALRGAGDAVLSVNDRHELHLLLAYASGDTAGRRRAVSELASGELSGLSAAVWHVAVFAQDVDGAREIARLGLAASASQPAHVDAHRSLLWLAAANGRLRETAAEAAWLRGHVGVSAADEELSVHAFLALLPFVQTSGATIDSARAALDSAQRADGLQSPGDKAQRCIAAMLRAARGDAAGALASMAQLTAMHADETMTLMTASCTRSVRARIALARHDSTAALNELLADRARSPAQIITEPLDRFLIAELLRARGRAAEAVSWYESIADVGMGELPLCAPAEQRLGEIAAARGGSGLAVARAHYARAAALWRGKDPEVRALGSP